MKPGERMEIEIDEHAIRLLALQQPMAGDLRLITAAIKINTDLEGMGDLTANIGKRALSLMDEPVVPHLIDVPHTAALVQNMVRKSLDAFPRMRRWRKAYYRPTMRGRPAERVFPRAHQFHAARAEPYTTSNESAVDRAAPRAVADHATNIAEDVLFYVKGVDVRTPR